ncbi:YheC/YheD family endospore coat-associated protein [Paenibacillus guangzhouensis]|uniref:YheC/YheD family endospore coat-associated protein n=1 Tax=Paenibacillus guangzhouensis TaxID=1473112 RepID=UPI001D0FF55E|nr:YheC/YheD family protein [Paenibacillus guangzhouensis]
MSKNRAYKSAGYLGIMVCETRGNLPIPEKSFCRRLCEIGRKHGITVFVFSPTWLRPKLGRVVGYAYTDKGWERGAFPIPKVVYDRCYYPTLQKYLEIQRAIQRLNDLSPITFLGRGLKGKWDVYQMMSNYESVSPHLPKTMLYDSISSLSEWIEACGGEAFLKPHGGSHGKNTLYVHRKDGKLFIRGRSASNEIIERVFKQEAAGYRWIHQWIGSRKFIMQPYLYLNNRNEEPFDIRSLVQKNEHGEWQLTGMAVRRGKPGSLTSNLHGGGHAESATPFLEREFGNVKTAGLIKSIKELSQQIPLLLEERHGRLAELGIDFGVDRDGNLWVLEVNSKPGRSIFLQMNDRSTALKSVENPILYARYLLLRQLRRVHS